MPRRSAFAPHYVMRPDDSACVGHETVAVDVETPADGPPLLRDAALGREQTALKLAGRAFLQDTQVREPRLVPQTAVAGGVYELQAEAYGR